MRILVANEPRAYREALGAALGVLRPWAAVLVRGPDQLDEAIERFAPHLVVCSRPVAGRRPAWVVADPDGLGLEDLLALVDAAAQWSETMP